jgi:hypothetical protein
MTTETSTKTAVQEFHLRKRASHVLSSNKAINSDRSIQISLGIVALFENIYEESRFLPFSLLAGRIYTEVGTSGRIAIFRFSDSYRTKKKQAEYQSSKAIGLQISDSQNWTSDSPIVIGLAET